VLKKAGVVVAVVAAGMLSVSPLAFATEGHHHDEDNVQHGLINVSDTTIQVPVQLCGNDVASGVLGILASDLSNKSNDDVDCEQENKSH
jgi:hypothetical protein